MLLRVLNVVGDGGRLPRVLRDLRGGEPQRVLRLRLVERIRDERERAPPPASSLNLPCEWSRRAALWSR